MKVCTWKVCTCRPVSILVLIGLLLFGPGSAQAGDFDSFDLAVGAGFSLNSNMATKQALIAPAVQWQLDQAPFLRFRLEGNLELIHHDGKLTIVAGPASMVRSLLFSGKRYGPYVEGGVGANYISRRYIKHRNMGGSFIFSPMAGAGYLFPVKGRDCSLAVRFRHISNADTYSNNAGLDSLYVLGSIAF